MLRWHLRGWSSNSKVNNQLRPIKRLSSNRSEIMATKVTSSAPQLPTVDVAIMPPLRLPHYLNQFSRTKINLVVKKEEMTTAQATINLTEVHHRRIMRRDHVDAAGLSF